MEIKIETVNKVVGDELYNVIIFDDKMYCEGFTKVKFDDRGNPIFETNIREALNISNVEDFVNKINTIVSLFRA